MAYAQRTIHALYKKLLGLYPPGFRERLGESMEQTFNDLWNERQADEELFGFVLWTFIETTVGIVQEHILSLKELNPMNSMLGNFRSSVIIGFLIVLPFILLEFTSVIIKKLTFDLRDALDSVVLFGILWLGVTAILLITTPIVQDLRAGNGSTGNPAFRGEDAKRNLLTHPFFAMIIGVVLALPFLTILSSIILGVEPPFGPLEPLLRNENPDRPHVLGTLVVLCAFLLSILGGVIIRTPIVRTMRAGGSVFTHPINLVLAVVILFFITWMVVGLVVDQFPCWIGIPNCD